MEQHRNLVTQHNNVSTHWATAIRQLILTLSPETDSDQNAAAQLPETEIVQFVDISSKPAVLDSSIPSFLQGPTPISEPCESPQMTSSDNSNADCSNASTNSNEPNQNASKSKFGRIGRILHI